MKLNVTNASVDWQPSKNTFLLGGTFNADFGVFQFDADARHRHEPRPRNRQRSVSKVNSISFQIENAVLGPITLQNLMVSYAADGSSFDLDVAVMVGLPGGFKVGGTFDLVKGQLDTIALSFSGPAGELEIPDTGLSISYVAAKLTNSRTPRISWSPALSAWSGASNSRLRVRPWICFTSKERSPPTPTNWSSIARLRWGLTRRMAATLGTGYSARGMPS